MFRQTNNLKPSLQDRYRYDVLLKDIKFIFSLIIRFLSALYFHTAAHPSSFVYFPPFVISFFITDNVTFLCRAGEFTSATTHAIS